MSTIFSQLFYAIEMMMMEKLQEQDYKIFTQYSTMNIPYK